MVKYARRHTHHKKNPFARFRAPTKKGFLSRYKNKSVVKAMKRPRAVSLDARQSTAIRKLGNQVRSLQLSKYGSKQFQYQSCFITSTIGVSPYTTQPIAFVANSFYENTPLWAGRVSNGVPSYAPLLQTPGQPLYPVVFQKQSYDVDLDNQYQWNEKNNMASVSKQEYLPIYANYKFRFTSSNFSQQRGIQRYRITMFKMKKTPTRTAAMDLDLPATLGSYWYMASDNLAERNYFSKSFHHIIADKFINFYPPTDTDAIKKINRTVSMSLPFTSSNSYKPDITSNPPGQEFWTNMAQDDLIWCLISSNLSDASQQFIKVDISRSLTWRDRTGVMQAT